MTPFPQRFPDEDEETYWQRIATMGGQPVQRPGFDSSTYTGLSRPEGYDDVRMPGYAAHRGASAIEANMPPPTPSLPAPPMAQGHSKLGMALAFIADLMLNKGRATPQLITHLAKGDDEVNYENYQRKLHHQKEKAALEWMARRGTMQGMDPQLYELRKGQLDLDRDRELRLARGGAGGLEGEGGLTAYQAAMLEERKAAREARQNEITAYQKAMLESSAAQRSQASELRAETAEAKREAHNATQSRQYAQDTEHVRQIARNLQELDAIAAKSPDDLPGVGQFDALKRDNSWPLIGAGEDGIAFRKLMKDSADLVLRSRTGAAAPKAEKDELEKYSAGNFSDDESAIRAGLALMRKHMTDELRSQAAGREEPAREVLRGAGISHLLPAAPTVPLNPASQGWKPPNGMPYLPVQKLPSHDDEDEWEDL